MSCLVTWVVWVALFSGLLLSMMPFCRDESPDLKSPKSPIHRRPDRPTRRPSTHRNDLRLDEEPMRAAIYARVSTFDQEPENQLQELRRYIEARGWTGTEYVDRGVSGAKDRRPALDQMLADAKRRKFAVLVCGRPARLRRNMLLLI